LAQSLRRPFYPVGALLAQGSHHNKQKHTQLRDGENGGSRRGERDMDMSADLRRLNGEQLRIVLEASQTLRPHTREAFLQSVAQALAGCSELGDGVVSRAVRTVLEDQRLYGERNLQI
jgi:hypothetical protein